MITAPLYQHCRCSNRHLGSLKLQFNHLRTHISPTSLRKISVQLQVFRLFPSYELKNSSNLRKVLRMLSSSPCGKSAYGQIEGDLLQYYLPKISPMCPMWVWSIKSSYPNSKTLNNTATNTSTIDPNTTSNRYLNLHFNLLS